jgi:nucleoside 2-deoxyribosyltransferase
MNCFVIMPFAPEFDDVYAVIKSTVEASASAGTGRCFRLDDSRPAGRITDRLLAELKAATLCVADLTGAKPNVMWEVGFAMALCKPTILLIQDITALPFDIKDMQSIAYDRARLSATLAAPLRRSVVDTLAMIKPTVRLDDPDGPSAEAFGSLLTEVAQLKQIVAEAVGAWRAPALADVTRDVSVGQLVGNWINEQSGSHLYSRVVHGDLVTPYCYSGNERLTGVYFDWRRVGEYWFARYKWLGNEPSGFTFLRLDTVDTLRGAWWDASEERSGDVGPPKNAGIPSSWVRQPQSEPPDWARRFLQDVERDSLAAVLARTK